MLTFAKPTGRQLIDRASIPVTTPCRHDTSAIHEARSDAISACRYNTCYWSPFPKCRVPKCTVKRLVGRRGGLQSTSELTFDLDQPTSETIIERSPFGLALGIRYPKANVDALLAASGAAKASGAAGPDAWAGVFLKY